MKTSAIILAGGEGSRLGILTIKRTKPAVPFGGKYRIIDFTLSNCVNSHIFDVVLIAQYRPHSLIEHIGAGGPWDLNRDFTGGVRIFTPYRSRRPAEWFGGTADAIQQNFAFVKHNDPDLYIVLSGDHIYAMDYEPMITFHMDHKADLTLATIEVDPSEAPRFGIVGTDSNYRVTSFVEKPAHPPSNLANMGVYIFGKDVLNRVLWEDHEKKNSSHDFGKDILPAMVADGNRVFAFPYSGYWVDVGTLNSYWKAHMDLLSSPPPLDLNNRSWVIHTRTEERPPVRISRGAEVIDSMLSDGCVIEPGARVINSVLSPGVRVCAGATVEESILLTDAIIQNDCRVTRSILDKRVKLGYSCCVGASGSGDEVVLSAIGKNSILPDNLVVEPGGGIANDVIPEDFSESVVSSGKMILTRRQPNEV